MEFFTPEEVTNLLRAVAPNCTAPEEWGKHLSTAMWKFGVCNHRQFVAAFIAQLMVESNELNRVAENLNYSAERLRVVWPKRFPSLEFARQYAYQPRALANFVYSNRMGNGPPASDDGWNFRGRGPIQNTGRANYYELQRALGIPLILQPELLEEKPVGSLSAAWFWWRNRLSFLAADLPDDDNEADFVTITRRINGGEHGLKARRTYWHKACAHLGISPEEVAA